MTTAHPHPEHPERALIRQLLAAPAGEWAAVTTNPLAAAMRMELSAHGPGHVSARFVVDQPFTNGNGVLQGGIVSAMLDFGMVFAAFSQIPADATIATVSQTTNFFRAAMPGAYIVEAELEKSGRTLINARATLSGADGKPVASATSPLAVLPLAR